MAIGNTISYLYKVTEFYLLFPTEEIELLPEALTHLAIFNDYEQNVLPITQINVTMSREAYFKLIAQKDKVKIRLRIQKYYTRSVDGKESLKSDYINDTFSIILNDNDENMYRVLTDQKTTTKKRSELEAIQHNNDRDVELFLYKLDIVKNIRSMVNVILKDCTITDAITYILHKSGISNTLLAPVTNTNLYDQIIIPPLSVVDALYWLDYFYGIYRYGTMFYFDLNRNYIMPYSGRSHVYEKDEIVENYIYCPAKGSSISASSSGHLLRSDDKIHPYTIVDVDTITIRNKADTTAIMEGLDARVINPYNNSIKDYNTKAKHKISNKRRNILNTTYNEYTGNIYTNISSSMDLTINAVSGYCDDSVLLPNHKYRMIFEDTALSKKYTGNFILSTKTSELIKSGNSMVMGVELMLKQDMINDVI